jgi:hypothetical protein
MSKERIKKSIIQKVTVHLNLKKRFKNMEIVKDVEVRIDDIRGFPTNDGELYSNKEFIFYVSGVVSFFQRMDEISSSNVSKNFMIPKLKVFYNRELDDFDMDGIESMC